MLYVDPYHVTSQKGCHSHNPIFFLTRLSSAKRRMQRKLLGNWTTAGLIKDPFTVSCHLLRTSGKHAVDSTRWGEWDEVSRIGLACVRAGFFFLKFFCTCFLFILNRFDEQKCQIHFPLGGAPSYKLNLAGLPDLQLVYLMKSSLFFLSPIWVFEEARH